VIAVENVPVKGRAVQMASVTLVAVRDATSIAIDILPHARPAGESEPSARIGKQNGGGQSHLPTPVDRPREESTVTALTIVATPSIAPEGAGSQGDITVSVTFNPTDPYGMIELNTSLNLEGEALLDTLDDLLTHVIVYRRGYRIEMLADRDTRDEVWQ